MRLVHFIDIISLHQTACFRWRILNHTTNLYISSLSILNIGIVTGILAAFAITLGVIGAVRIYKAVLPGSRGNAAGRTESIINRSVERKLGVLEDTIKKYFWKDVEETIYHMIIHRIISLIICPITAI